jgi:hypothetical protein
MPLPPQVVSKVGGTIDDSEMVDGMVFDQKVGGGLLYCTLGACRLPRTPLNGPPALRAELAPAVVVSADGMPWVEATQLMAAQGTTAA